MTSANRISQERRLPGQEEFFDAVRRHICQVLGFDLALIDLVRGHEVVNFSLFTAADPDEEGQSFVRSLHDEDEQPLTVAHTMLAQKVKQSQRPWVGRAYSDQGGGDGYPYVIVPIIDGPAPSSAGLREAGPTVVKGLIRVVCFDEGRHIDDKDISTLRLIAQHLSSKLSDMSEALDEEERYEQPGAGVEAECVLVVHANRPVRRRLKSVLLSRYRVLEADSGEKAIELLKDNHVDLIVLDNTARAASGVSLLPLLKDTASWKYIPIILVTSDNDVGGKVEGLNAGADDCLSESCHEAELLARVRASLRLRKTERELGTQWQLLEDYAQRLESVVEAERQANMKVAKHNQSLEQLNRELHNSKLKEQVLRGQEQLLHRISDIIRHSFNINENIGKTLEELAGHFSLDCCFVVLPSEEEPQDTVRSEYATEEEYNVLERNLDLAILDVFRANFTADQAVVVSDVARERIVEPFRKEALASYPVRSLFYLPITYEEKLLGLIGGHKCESETLWTTENKNFLKAVAGQVAIGVTNARLYARVQRQATSDGLTGLYNHRTGQEKLSEQLRFAERYQRNLAVVMIDVDHFKSINDTFGHPAGDSVLRFVARQIRNDCRDVDIPVRYGGEEFLIILPEVNQEGAVVLAERIRRNLERQTIRHEDIEINVTASVGVAAFPEDAGNQQQLLELADRALYMSKRLGRNQVHTAGDLMFSEFKHPAQEPKVVPVEPEAAVVPAAGASDQIAPAVAPGGDKGPQAEKEELVPEVVEMVKALATALYSKSDYYKEHHLETARFSELVAKIMGLSSQEVEEIRVASLLHDVGVLSIPEDIINKPGLVTSEEMEVIAQHPTLGAQLLRPIRALKDICDIVENHHECWDGTGYPRGLKGEEIPLAARILAIVDAYHAMISDRPYRPAMSNDQAKKALRNGAGTQWDPFLVDIFIAVLDSLEEAGNKQ